jgi:phage gp29-like protein
MARTTSQILDQFGRPIQREILTQEIAGPRVGSVRSPISGYPADGLNPVRLANILRAADAYDPLRFFELAEQIEERDLHYAGVLGTRKRQVSQLDIQVDPADDTPEAKAHAAWIEAGLKRDTLQSEIFDMLDAIGKGFSASEILWDTSEGDWNLKQLLWRDPRWFRFDRNDGTTPLLVGSYDADGVANVIPPTTPAGESPLAPFKFVICVIRAKSGLPVRSGLARLVAWAWMFKAFTQRDWAIFSQTFGQSVRVGKYPAGSTAADKDTLFRAVANIAGDCAAIIPETMAIEFIESQNVGPGSDLYEKRCNWLDQQVSKAVLGQTATTDAIAGGHAVGQEHRQVQEDIERADAKALSAILNRDLVRPWIDLQFGPQKQYPRVRIGRAEDTDVRLTVESAARLVPMGLKVKRTYFNDLLGIPVPEDGEDLLTAPASSGGFGGSFSGFPSLNASTRLREAHDPIAYLTEQAEQLCGPGADAVINEVRDVVERSTSLHQVQEELKKLKPGIAERNLAGLMRMARVLANLMGRASIPNA